MKKLSYNYNDSDNEEEEEKDQVVSYLNFETNLKGNNFKKFYSHPEKMNEYDEDNCFFLEFIKINNFFSNN